MKKLAVGFIALGTVMLIGQTSMAANTSLPVTANVVGACQVSTPPTGLAFGALDPSAPVAVADADTLEYWCTKGATYTISDDAGLWDGGGSNKMRHATDVTEFIAYTMTLTDNGTGTGVGPTSPTVLDIAGNIAAGAYTNSLFGDYADTVVITIAP